MSLSLKWMAMQGGGRDLLLDHLGFVPIGEASNELNLNYACCDLPGGWVVFAATGYNFPIENAVKDLPAGPLALAAERYESVMFSSLRAYQDGAQIWSVVHDPDKDSDSVAVEGEPPAVFKDLKRELDAEQSAEEDRVDHIFELPDRLGKSLCGYEPGQSEGVVWTVLGAKGSKVRQATRSITDAIRSELVPYLQSLGWEPPKSRADVSSPGNMVRRVDGQVQTIFFAFMSGPQTFIQVIFETEGKRLSGDSHPLRGMVDYEPIRPSVGKWQRFFNPRLAPPDPIDEAIVRAKADILAADEFLKTDVRKPGIQFFRQWERDADGTARPVVGDPES
jgi:hypothetical protein